MIVVLPMAGRGSRFAGSGYNTPKPFIMVEGKPMFALALSGLLDMAVSQLVIVALEEHVKQFGIVEHLPESWRSKTTIVAIPDVTEGQLCTVLAASNYIDKEEDMLIVSSDTIVVSELAKEIKTLGAECGGLISVADMPGDRWSFARTDETGKVVEVAEKVHISNHASTGLYYFSSGKQFCTYGQQMVESKETTKGEYYVIPVYKKYIDNNQWIGISEASAMHDLGTPDSLNEYLSTRK